MVSVPGVVTARGAVLGPLLPLRSTLTGRLYQQNHHGAASRLSLQTGVGSGFQVRNVQRHVSV